MPNPLAGTRLYAQLGNTLTLPLWSFLSPPSCFAVLTTVGRKTARKRRVSVRAIRDGEKVYLVAMLAERAAWLKNVRANPQVTIRLGMTNLHGRAREVVDPDERKLAADVWIQTTNPSDYVDYVMYHWGVPTRSRIERAHQQWFDDGVPVVIELRRSED